MEYYYDLQHVADKVMEEIRNQRMKMAHFNILISGKTGVGKSTLLNRVFGADVAEAGTGRPITEEILKYTKEDAPITIYDTPGLELGGENKADELLGKILELCRRNINTGNMDEAIHCVWYCVNTASHRFEEAEKEFIERILAGIRKMGASVPVFIVLTQSFSKRDAAEMKSVIEAETMDIEGVIPVLADKYEIDEGLSVQPFGLEELINRTLEAIPEKVKDTFIAVQRVDTKLKSKKAQAVVVGASASAAGLCAIPVPVADAAMLVPNQIAMMASIAAVYNLPIQKSTMTTVISATIGTMGATVLGKTIVSSILKCIPGVGTVAGIAISGSIAAALTAALGEAFIGVMNLISTGKMDLKALESEEGKRVISELFKSKLRLKRDAKGNALDGEKEE